MSPATIGRLDAVCVVYADLPNIGRPVETTAIDKRPVTGPVEVQPLGLAGDHVCDTKNHGGLDQAVYAYAEDDAQRWGTELGRALPAGWFGENLRISGLAVSDAVVGAHWRIGDVVLEVTAPRIPCATFGRWSQERQWVKRFAARGDTGAYFRVVTTGSITAGDEIVIDYTPAHGVTVRDLFDGTDPARMELLLAEQPDLSTDSFNRAKRHLERHRA
ncbi:MOSC domain-containing protein [Skermania sp. ID1734]|uniref:MOSC domain-containing protein n=1 Tax=Skermania sp. ID1734 TaxID=2597516 RepID=UPI00117F6D41|nr:MOSC domain-containing protein [Skermania sp. ID1734]TSD96545.1 MOSC domain-containing protein [Skermania sp. ID1734]